MTDTAELPVRHVHTVMRRNGSYIMLYSEKYHYYVFPHATAEAAESPEQAVYRIAAVQTGRTVLPKSIRPCCNVIFRAADGRLHEHLYFRCKIDAAAPAALPAPPERFALTEVSRKDALLQNRPEGHGILSEDGQFRAMLERENHALWSFRRLGPLLGSLFVLIGLLLIPVLLGLFYAVTGFHSPTDGGTVYGANGFLIGLVFGGFLASPFILTAFVCLIISLSRQFRPHKEK